MSRRLLSAPIAASGLMALVAFTLGAEPAAQGTVKDERKEARQWRFAGEGPRTLDVRNFNGSIRVIGDGGADVRLEAAISVEAENQDALADARRNLTIEGREQGTTVTITVRDGEGPVCGEQGNWRQSAWWDRRRYDASTALTIRTPRDVRVRMCAVNGAEVTAEGTQGDFDISNVNGRIVLKGLRGSGRASTVNGAIEAAFDAAPRDESLFKTVNGDVTVTMPASLAADLRIKTMRGSVFTDFDTVEQPVPRELSRRAGEPRFRYQRRGFTGYRVGGGGPVLSFETLNGDVKIQRAAR
jgi:hypothetical protein